MGDVFALVSFAVVLVVVLPCLAWWVSGWMMEVRRKIEALGEL